MLGPARLNFPKSGARKKLRIGYVSSDLARPCRRFRSDRSLRISRSSAHFEIFAYYCGISHVDTTQTRIKAHTDHWTDINAMSDEEAAQQIVRGPNRYSDRSQRLYDECTHKGLLPIGLRPSSSIGSAFPPPWGVRIIIISSLILSSFRTSRKSTISEKIVRMPCYQPNDRKRDIAEKRPLAR